MTRIVVRIADDADNADYCLRLSEPRFQKNTRLNRGLSRMARIEKPSLMYYLPACLAAFSIQFPRLE